MKTEQEINDAIVKITMLIQQDYPELSKYISEMPVTNPDEKNPDLDIKKLEEYYDSLLSVLQKYDVTHTPRGN